MKNVLLKFAGLFIEKVPVDQTGAPIKRSSLPQPNLPAGAQPPAAPAAAPPATQPMAPGQQYPHPQQPQYPQQQPGQPLAPAQFHPGQQQVQQPAVTPGAGSPQQQPISIALRAWVPQEYAAHLAPFGVHVIAAGGSVTSEQARSWGAQVLVVSAECLGQDIHLLQQPQLPTVFIAPQPVMIPDVPGVVQVQEPLRASDVANAARDAAAAFANARR